MTQTLAELQAQVRAQKTLIPSLYGNVDFDIVPERFTTDAGERSMLPPPFARKYRRGILANQEKIDRALAYTMLGDNVADAYAALTPKYGFRRLIDMLVKACEQGIDAVPDAPAELATFIASMEKTPDWLDMELVEQGARAGRVAMANIVPFAIRGAFIATFLNKYSGLPMALTGALSQETSVQRVKETASFFTTATLPGALTRYGTGFRAAAMVRLMHSMVRFNLLKHAPKWDINVYGIPIPQVDQMPAGTMPSFITAFKVVKAGRDTFTPREQATVEFCRYQCYLLGLPEDLLPNTPQGIFDAMTTYAATLRDGYDDETNGALVRATMSAYMPPDNSLKSRAFDTLEKSFSKVFFTRAFQVQRSKAELMGVQPSLLDYALFIAGNLYILPRMAAHHLAERVPFADELSDKMLIHEINKLLVSYGHAEYTTDASRYNAATA
ncbi:MAG: oxygenase MpaB family protein [Pseudomonadota bacterium]